jgi:hypothetical protein
VAKDKKKKKSNKKAGLATKAGKSLKTIGKNPMVADVVAAALVATVAALKNPKKAQRLAMNAGDELTKLSKAGAKQGSALWEMALQIGRESLEALSSDSAASTARKSAARKPAARKAAARKPAAHKTAARKPAARKTAVRTSAVRKPAAKRTTTRKRTTARASAKKPK